MGQIVRALEVKGATRPDELREVHAQEQQHDRGEEAERALARRDGKQHQHQGDRKGRQAEMGQRRNEEAARLADSRTEAFFAEHLA